MEHDINNLKIEVAVINEKLDSQGKKIDEVLDMLKQHIKDEEERYSDIMEKKADRWVQTAVTTIISVICLGVISALLALVVK